MSAWLIAGINIAAWLTAARYMFRYARRHDVTIIPWRCTHPDHSQMYRQMGMDYKRKCCIPVGFRPMRVPELAILSMICAIVWPLALVAVLITWRAPESPVLMRNRIEQLERELEMKP